MKLASVLSVFLSLAIISQAAPTNYSKRSFGNESSPQAIAVFQGIKSITQGTDKEAEGADLSVEAIKALFADAPACDQQDRADDIIDLGHVLGGEKEKQLIDVAKEYRQLERNTLTEGQQSEPCAKPPKNIEINGLLQAQDLTTNAAATPVTPNEPDPDDPDQSTTATPNEPDPDDPDQSATVTPNEPDPDDPDQSATATPNEPDPDDPDTGKDDTGKVLPKDPDEDSESNNDGNSTKSNVPQGFA